ncbi:MAG: efflux RND transporter periplasmic adaptor subunit [Gemmataceae bacterium]|nr:efflux RND transporter periplasmic adaptor subunit [Gemmataceae bacterium]
MKPLLMLSFAVGLAVCVGQEFHSRPVAGQPVARADGVSANAIEATGRTQCIPSRRGVIATTLLQPVTEVLVSPGERVKKGQVLIKLDDGDLRADLQSKKAALALVQVFLREHRRLLKEMERLFRDGALSEQRVHESRTNVAKSEADELVAAAAVEVSRNALDGSELKAPTDGVISWMAVSPGSIVRPGAGDWGEILDLRELDVRCDLTPAQADQLQRGQAAEVRLTAKTGRVGTGKIAWIGIAADRTTGLVPVVVRLANPGERLRAEVPVHVRFIAPSGEAAK